MVLFPIAAAFLAALASDALSERVSRYQMAEGAEARVIALEQVAALAGGRDAPEPEALCLALAQGLEDELYAVRARAVALVAAAGPPALAAAELLDASVAQVAVEREVDAHVRTFEPGDLSNVFSRSKKAREKALDDLERMTAQAEAMLAYLEPYANLPTVREALVKALPAVRDDRAVEGLAVLFEDAGFGESADPMVAGLLAFGTAPALEALAQHVPRYEEARKERDARARELARMKPAKKPSDLWADDVWKKHEKERIAKLQADFELAAGDQDAWMEAYAQRLRDFGEAQGLGKPPRGLKPARAWTSWAVDAREVLPASVSTD